MHEPALIMIVEPLEDRRLLSVSAATLAGPLAKGTAWSFRTTGVGSTINYTLTSAGPVKLGRMAVTEIDNTQKVGVLSTVNRQYISVNSAGCRVQRIVTQSKAPGYTTTVTHQPAPANQVFPARLSGGLTYSYKWTDTITTVSMPGDFSQKQIASVFYTVKLVSEKQTRIKVPAGTFRVYTVQTTLSTRINGNTTRETNTRYIAPGVGVVKIVADSTTSVLTKYVKPRR